MLMAGVHRGLAYLGALIRRLDQSGAVLTTYLHVVGPKTIIVRLKVIPGCSA
jgi:hypothetical protein